MRQPRAETEEELADRVEAVHRRLNAPITNESIAALHMHCPDDLCTLERALEHERGITARQTEEIASLEKIVNEQYREIDHLRECHVRVCSEVADGLARVGQLQLLLEKVTAERDRAERLLAAGRLNSAA